MKKTVLMYVIPAVFGVLGVFGVLYFGLSPQKSSNQPELAGASGNVVIWGTFPSTPELQNFFSGFNKTYDKAFSVTYVYHDPKQFDSDIVEALANQKGPDILLLPDDLILRHSQKIYLMQYTPAFGQREYLDRFVEASEIYLRPDGMLAFPFVVDPMVMYWNRDMFTNESIAQPPKYWDEFLTLTPKLTKKDKSLKLIQSALPFGEFTNVKNAKEILATLFLQTGSQIVAMNNGVPGADLIATSNDESQGVDSALRFFMDFSNPQKSIYTWSRSRQNSEDEFLNGNLAVYFDYASRYNTLKEKNPHLNFDVAMMPQLRDAKAQMTYGKVHGLVALKASKNRSTAFVAIQRLLDQKFAEQFAKAFDLPPVRRDLLSKRPNDAAQAVFYDSVLRSRTWLDPKPDETDKMFETMIESISSGRNTIKDAFSEANTRLGVLIQSVSK